MNKEQHIHSKREFILTIHRLKDTKFHLTKINIEPDVKFSNCKRWLVLQIFLKTSCQNNHKPKSILSWRKQLQTFRTGIKEQWNHIWKWRKHVQTFRTNMAEWSMNIFENHRLLACIIAWHTLYAPEWHWISLAMIYSSRLCPVHYFA